MCVIHSFREQNWRESTFNGLKLVRGALDEAFGAGKVSLISAAFQWLNHHSQMKPKYNGEWESGSLGPASQLQNEWESLTYFVMCVMSSVAAKHATIEQCGTL